MAIRRKIEKYFEATPDTSVINEIWPYLNHDDRHIRYAATMALMHQPVTMWGKKAFRERNIRTVNHVMLSLANIVDPALLPIILRILITSNYTRYSTVH